MTTNASETNITVRNPDNAVIIITDLIFICTGAIGSFANILIIFVICRTRSLRTSMNANLVSLSVADLIVCIFLIPVRLILYNIDNSAIGSISVLCRIDVFLKTMCDSAQLFMLVATSFERYQSIARPFEKQGHVKRTVVSVTVSWLLSLGLGIFTSQYCGDGGTIYPCYDQTHQIFSGHWGDKEKNITLPVGLICLFMVVVFYGRIMKLLNEHNTSMQKRFKTKVSPAEKIVEKSTSNAVLKINSTVHVPIPKPTVDGQVHRKGNEQPNSVQTGQGHLQNGVVSVHKSAIIEDSGYNEPEPTARTSDPKLDNDNGMEDKDHEHDHTFKQKDSPNNPKQGTIKYFNNLANQTKNIHTFPEGSSPLASWRKIIRGRMFNTHTRREQIEHSSEPIKVLNVRETKRFPLIRERTTLAKLETSRAEKAEQKTNEQSSFTQRKRGTMSKAKSVSDMYQYSVPKRNQTFFKPTYKSLATLRAKDNANSNLSKTSDNHVYPNGTLNDHQNATISSTKDCDKFDTGKPHLTALRKVSRVIMALMPIHDSEVTANKAAGQMNETQGPSTDITGVNMFTPGERKDTVKLTDKLNDKTENNDTNQTNETIPLNMKSYRNEMKTTTGMIRQNSTHEGSKQNEVVSWKTKTQQNNTQEESKQNEVVNLKAKQTTIQEESKQSEVVRWKPKTQQNNTHEESKQNEVVSWKPKTQQNVTLEESEQNEVVSWKAKIKKDSLQRVEVVEMDGTVHKKVKVESGAVVGAVCVMNNSNRVQGRRKVEMRTAKNIAILIGTFILLWLPLPVVVIIMSSSLDISKVSVEPVLIIASASSLTVALNPILNVLLNKQMRSRTINTLENCKSKIR